MDISLIIVLWVIIFIAQAINDRKKAPPPPQMPPQDLDFEIPNLSNDPNNLAEVEEFDEEFYVGEVKELPAAKIKSEVEPIEEKNSELDLTPAAMMNSIIMNEILDKPKALRRKKF